MGIIAKFVRPFAGEVESGSEDLVLIKPPGLPNYGVAHWAKTTYDASKFWRE
jgi:hypothetical protein